MLPRSQKIRMSRMENYGTPFTTIVVVWMVFWEILVVSITEELIEDVDRWLAEEWFVVVAAVFVEGTGWTAIWLTTLAVLELIAGSLAESFEVVIDGACEARTAIDTDVYEPTRVSTLTQFLRTLFKNAFCRFERVTDWVYDVISTK